MSLIRAEKAEKERVAAAHAAKKDQDADIAKKRDQRGDEAEQFGYLGELPHHPWLGAAQFSLTDLRDHLVQYRSE